MPVSQDALRGVHKDTRRRWKRMTFSKAQLVELERAFSLTHYPDVKVWFQNRCARYFKSNMPQETQSPPAIDRSVPQFPCTPTPNPTTMPPQYTSLPPRYPSPGLAKASKLSSGCVPGSQTVPGTAYLSNPRRPGHGLPTG
ncbi:unnamed protein product [Coregonus sp. 'balchen']|nr:unnamed protein product [Coregonus sp. 'balchen']